MYLIDYTLLIHYKETRCNCTGSTENIEYNFPIFVYIDQYACQIVAYDQSNLFN